MPILPLIGMLGRAALASAASGMGGAREESSSQEDTGDSKGIKGMKKNTDKMSSKGWVKKAGSWMGIGALLKQSAVASSWFGGFSAIIGGYISQLLLPFNPLVSRLLKVFAFPLSFTASLSSWFHLVFETYFHMIELTITYLWGTLLNLGSWLRGLSFEDIAENIKKVVDWTTNFITNIVKKIKDFLFGGEDDLGAVVTKAVGKFFPTISVAAPIKEAAGNAMNFLSETLDGLTGGGGGNGSAIPLNGMLLDNVQGGVHATAGGALTTGASSGAGVHQNSGTGNVDTGYKEPFVQYGTWGMNAHITDTTQRKVKDSTDYANMYGTEMSVWDN